MKWQLLIMTLILVQIAMAGSELIIDDDTSDFVFDLHSPLINEITHTSSIVNHNQNFKVITSKISLYDAQLGYSEFYDIVINATTRDTFTFSTPATCTIQHPSIVGSGILTNKISCYKSANPYNAQVQIKSSTYSDSTSLAVLPQKTDNFLAEIVAGLKNDPLSLSSMIVWVIMFMLAVAFLLTVAFFTVYATRARR